MSTRPLFVFAFAAGLLAPASAVAAEREVILVTGRAPDPRPDDAPASTASLSVLDAAAIEARADLALADLLRLTPGAAISRSGPLGGLTQVRLRGAEGNHTLLLIDGVEVADPFTGEPDFANLFALDVARIEVLRGEQSALWGADAIGGAINVTRDQGPGLALRAEAGSDATYAFAASGAAEDDRAFARFGLTALGSNGFDASGLNGERDGYQAEGLDASGRFALTPRFSAAAGLSAQTALSAYDEDADFDGRLDDLDRDLETETLRGYARADHEIQGERIAIVHGPRWSHVEQTRETRADAAFVGASKGARSQIAYDVVLSPQTSGDETPSGDWAWSAAGRIERETERLSNRGPAPDAFENQSRTTASDAVAGEIRAAWRERLRFDLSARRETNEDFEDATTWRAGAAIEWPEVAGRLRASTGEGVKNPGFFERFGFFPDFFVGNPNLKPERSQSWELGWDQRLGDRLTASLTYFDAELEDEIFTDFPVGLFATANNRASTSTRQGVELEARWSPPIDGVQVIASAAFIQSEEAGVAEIRRPETSASVLGVWAPEGSRWAASLGVDYVGETTDIDFGAFETVTLDDYALARARLAYEVVDGVDLYVRGENLSDERYVEVFGYATPGASLYAGVTLKR